MFAVDALCERAINEVRTPRRSLEDHGYLGMLLTGSGTCCGAWKGLRQQASGNWPGPRSAFPRRRTRFQPMKRVNSFDGTLRRNKAWTADQLQATCQCAPKCAFG